MAPAAVITVHIEVERHKLTVYLVKPERKESAQCLDRHSERHIFSEAFSVWVGLEPFPQHATGIWNDSKAHGRPKATIVPLNVARVEGFPASRPDKVLEYFAKTMAETFALVRWIDAEAAHLPVDKFVSRDDCTVRYVCVALAVLGVGQPIFAAIRQNTSAGDRC